MSGFYVMLCINAHSKNCCYYNKAMTNSQNLPKYIELQAHKIREKNPSGRVFIPLICHINLRI